MHLIDNAKIVNFYHTAKTRSIVPHLRSFIWWRNGHLPAVADNAVVLTAGYIESRRSTA